MSESHHHPIIAAFKNELDELDEFSPDMLNELSPRTFGLRDWVPGKFYGLSTDAKGHRDTIRVNAPQGTASMIEYVLQSGAFPDARTSHDLIRHWIVCGAYEALERIGEMDAKGIAPFVLWREMERLQEARRLSEGMLEGFRSALKDVRGRREYEKLVELAQAQLDLMDEDDPARSELTGILEREGARHKAAGFDQ